MTPDELDDLAIAATYWRVKVAIEDKGRPAGTPYRILAGDMRRIVAHLHDAYLEVKRLTAVETELRADIQRLEQITRHAAG